MKCSKEAYGWFVNAITPEMTGDTNITLFLTYQHPKTIYSINANSDTFHIGFAPIYNTVPTTSVAHWCKATFLHNMIS